jgi:hypothetical protein
MKHIEVNVKGKVVLIDLEDSVLFESRTWRINDYGYVYSSKTRIGHKKQIFLHRFILGYSGELLVDHINRNKLDNRKSNLRLVTATQNVANSVKQNNCSSKYKGVAWRKDRKKWHAQILINNKHVHIGYFNDETEAAKAYDSYVMKYKCEYASINFPTVERNNTCLVQQ